MTPYHDPEGDRMAHLQFCLIADKIEADPSLLRIPLANIALRRKDQGQIKSNAFIDFERDAFNASGTLALQSLTHLFAS